MATITLNKKFLASGHPDGYVDSDIVRSRLFRKTAVVDGTTNAGDTFTSSDYIVLAALPKGFVLEGTVVDVLKANASAATATVYVAKNATGSTFTDSDLISLGTASLGTAGQYFNDLLPSGAIADTAVTLTSKKWIAGDNDLLVIKSSADVDAEFILRAFGRWMPPVVEA